MDSVFKIQLQIAGRHYPLNINRNDEEIYRKAARLVNEKISQYQQRYRDRDGQDLLAMAAFQFAFRVLELESREDDQSLLTAMEELTEDLEEFMQRN